MRSSFLLLLTFLLGVTDIQAGSDFRVCAFNTQHFGESKSQKSDVMQTLVKIITRCDVCLLQEVRDSKGKALKLLLEHLKRYDTKHEYKAVASERLGRSETYQEQYVFVYRTDTVTVADQYQYPDDKPGDIDAFSREPFVVRFRAPKTAIKEFVLIPQHTTPANTTKELDALYDVLQHNVMLLGDFNAGCGYLAKKNRKRVRLITDQNLFWLIQENTDTTVRSSTSCSYDRSKSVDVLTLAVIFVFFIQALLVSDHYPVEVLLKVVDSRGLDGGTSITSGNQFIALFVLSHVAFQILTR
uniref:Deoxyribonuclease n=1 Tax=Amphilophus citrinellus TaxID=61819 RepID=A0A3Q0RBJ4_AMPCI